MNRLKELRKKAKKTQRQMGEFLNVSQSAYGRYERGERDVPVGIYRNLAKYYNGSIEYLMGDDGAGKEGEK